MSYAHARYAQSLADFGSPRRLPACDGWVLERTIPGPGGRRDATGCYPLFRCADWGGLPDDLAALRQDGIVSLVLVADPLGGAPPGGFATHFPDLARPWKTHYLVDLRGDPAALGSVHHRRNARRVLHHVTVEACGDPPAHLDIWCALYDELIRRHEIRGTARFSRDAFAAQLALPGAVLLRAVTADGATVGMQLWLTAGEVAWHHLSGYAPAGYHWGGASYALMQAALVHLADRGVRLVDLGAGAGLASDPQDGLTAFKAGWSNGTRPTWLCGVVLDRGAYAALTAGRAGDYFPLYRVPSRPEVSHAHVG